MKHLASKQTLMLTLSLLGTVFFSMSTLSKELIIKSNLETMSKSDLQLMNESDLGNVSALSGNNILSILGAPAAGLTIDIDENGNQTSSTSFSTTKNQESEKNNGLGKSEIRTIVEDNSDSVNIISAFHVDETELNKAIHDAKEVVNKSNFQSTSTSSEVRYKESNVHHKMTPISENKISMQSDVFIDQFRFDNLKGNDDHRPSAGQVFFSNIQATTQVYTTAD